MRKPRQEGSSSGDPEAEASGKARGLSRKSTREAPSNPVGGQKIRCAIYTRKSSRKGSSRSSTPSTRNAKPARRMSEAKNTRAGAFCLSFTMTLAIGRWSARR